MEWLEQLDDFLSTENYLQRFFRADMREASAVREVLSFAAGDDFDRAFDTEAAAEAWLQRVQTWKANLQNGWGAPGVCTMDAGK